MAWSSIIRFKDASGRALYGEPDADLKRATVYEGDSILSLTKTDRTADITQVGTPYCYFTRCWLC